jgi:DNA polymerase-3 subunit delta'
MDEHLPWHDPLWQQVQQRRAADRLPHALLLAGPTGLGKLMFARRLAQALLCESPAAEGNACGQCRSCRLFRAGSHPDYSVVQPEDEQKSGEGDLSTGDTGSSKKKKSKVIKIDQIRDLCAFLGYTAQYGGYKIALLEPADQLNVNAANSLLKTLEEPPGTCLLLLVAARPARLPATVRSRCQLIRFDRPSVALALPWLTARIGSDLNPAMMLDVAGGSPLVALSYAEGDRWRRRRELAESYDQTLTGRLDPILAAEAWTQGDLAENLRWLIGWHTDLIRLRMNAVDQPIPQGLKPMNPEPPRLSHPDLRPLLRRWAARPAPRVLFERLDAAVRLHTLCTTAQVNAPLLLEAFLSEAADG